MNIGELWHERRFSVATWNSTSSITKISIIYLLKILQNLPMNPKIFKGKIKWVFKMQGVEVWLPWSNIILTKGCRLIVCQVQNADLIAVSLACPKDPTSPYRMHMGPPTESSVRNLLEKVGNLRDIAVLVQLNLAFLTFIDLHLHSQIVSDYHPLF